MVLYGEGGRIRRSCVLNFVRIPRFFIQEIYHIRFHFRGHTLITYASSEGGRVLTTKASDFVWGRREGQTPMRTQLCTHTQIFYTKHFKIVLQQQSKLLHLKVMTKLKSLNISTFLLSMTYIWIHGMSIGEKHSIKLEMCSILIIK